MASSTRSGGVADYLRLVKFSHSIFALPFALLAAWVAADGVPAARLLVWIVLCAVAARSAAMAFNRLVDRDLDAENPRTQDRELPRGALSVQHVRLLVVLASAAFVAGAFQINPLCGWLSPAVLVVLGFYSLTKRFTFLAHGFLGLALGLAPLGAWLAVRGTIDASAWTALLLASSVMTWVAGFDLIYACQDAEFDAQRGLHSVPARFGKRSALGVARALHVITVLLWLGFAWTAGLSWIFLSSVLIAAGLLLKEHRLVSADDLSKVDTAFFTLNGWVGAGLFVGGALDLMWA